MKAKQLFYGLLCTLLSISLMDAKSCVSPATVVLPQASCSSNVVHISQSSIGATGYVVPGPGVYCIVEDLTSPGGIPVISITDVNNVVILGGGYTIDLAGKAGTGILITGDAVQGVEIKNLTIQNSGKPGAVAPTLPTPIPPFFTATSITEFYDEFLTSFQTAGIQNPLPTNNTFDATGIGLKGNVSAITIENVWFLNMFIGISSNSVVSDIKIDNCQAYNGGFNYTSVFPAGDLSAFRGGFIIFFNPNTDPAVTVRSENINISNCIGSSPNWQYGVALYTVGNSTVTNCKMNSPSSLGSFFNAVSNYILWFSTNCVVSKCNSWGSNDGFGFIFSNNGSIKDSNAFGYTDEGVTIDFTQFYIIDNCKATNLQINTESPGGLGNIGYGITAIASFNSTIINSEASNNVKPLGVLGNEGSGIAILSANSVFKNNISYGNSFGGVVVAGSSNCLIENNIANDNELGFVDAPSVLIPTVGNAYIANIARSNVAVNYFGLPAGTPIRIWTLPGAPAATDSNGILDPQLDNMDIRP